MQILDLFGDIVDNNCEKCTLNGKYEKYFEPSGKGEKEILIVTPTPLFPDDELFQILEKKLSMFSINLKKDCWLHHSVSCDCTRKLTDTHVKTCRKNLNKVLVDLKPKYVFLFGTDAIKGLLQPYVQTSSAFALSGRRIPFLKYNCWVFPFLDLSMLNIKFDKNLDAYYRHTFKKAIQFIRDPKPFTKIDYLSPIKMSTDAEEICDWLDNLLDNPELSAIDIEATGLNPFRHGIFTITSVGITTKSGTFSFPLDYPGIFNEDELDAIEERLIEYLEREDLPKIAHRSQFEKTCLEQYFNVKAADFYWCTKVGEHLCDNREGITGLKHIAFVRWGIHGWDKDADKYIKSPDTFTPNRMQEMPIEKQLLYVGIDSFLTFKLYEQQRKELKIQMGDLSHVHFFNAVSNMFTEMTTNGFCVDMEYYQRKKKELTNKINEYLEELNESQEAIKYCIKRGVNEINWRSNDDLRDFFFNFLKVKSGKKTASGKASTDEEALNKIDHWSARSIVKIRKLEKVRDTYIAQYEREEIDGKIHPIFNVYIPATFRSSCSSPNLQNTPKRLFMAMLAVRSGLKPSPGNRLLEIDFDGAEVSTSAAYNKDPNLIEYLNPSDHSKAGDMHRDNAADIWITIAENITKMVRFYAKNNWTFPQFYGDWYESCAKAMWEHRNEKLEDGTTCAENLAKHGIKTLKQFINHCKKAEKIMWEERFKVYSEWKKEREEFYQKNFYIDTYLGFRFTGYMDRKQVANYQIQGTSFHLLLIVLLKMRKWLKETDMKTKIIGQVHDSGLFDSPENEYREVIAKFEEFTAEIYHEYDWFEVPMTAEADISLVDGDFAHMFEYKKNTPIEDLEKDAIIKWKKQEMEMKEAA